MPTRSNELEIGSDTTLDNPNKSTSKEWKLKNVQWKQVWRRQDHANLVLLAGLIVGVAVASFAVDPRDSYYYIYDGMLLLVYVTSGCLWRVVALERRQCIDLKEDE